MDISMLVLIIIKVNTELEVRELVGKKGAKSSRFTTYETEVTKWEKFKSTVSVNDIRADTMTI